MATTPQPMTLDPNDPIERWAKQGGVRGGATGWTADALQGKSMMPPATPMQNMADGLRAGTTPAAAPVAPPAAPKYTPPPVNPTTGRYVSNEQVPRSSQGFQGGDGLRQAGQRATPVEVGGPTSGVQANRAGTVPVGRSGIFGSIREGVKDLGAGVGNLRAGLGAQPGSISKSTFLAGKVLASPLVAGAGRLAVGVDAYRHLGDYKINDPEVDSSASGTWGALRNGDFAGAGRSLSKGALETGMDLGSFAANTADYVVPGKAPVSTAYNRMLRNNFGDQLIDNSGSDQDEVPVNKAPAASYPQASAVSAQRSLRQGDPSSSDLNDIHSNAMIENRNPGGKVTKVVGPGGKVSYSGGNVSGEVSFQDADGNALRGRPGGGYVSSSAEDGAARLAEARANLRNPDGSQWSASDNAIMAANIRDGVDKYRGTSRGAGTDKYANMPIKMATAMRVQDAQAAAQRENTNTLNQTTLRGQDMDMERAMAPIKLAAQMRKYSAEIFQAAGGDNAKAARMMQQAGLDPKQFLDVQASELANSTNQQTQLKNARESGKDRFKGVFVKKGKDGDERDDLGEARAEHMLNQLTKGQFSQMGEAEQQASQKDAIDLANMFGQIQTPKMRGFDKIGNHVGLVNDPVNLSEMPDFSKGTAKRRGLGMTYGVDSGSWDVTDSKGTVHNFQNLEKSQIKLLQKLGVTVPNH